jgi:hypothetical protein
MEQDKFCAYNQTRECFLGLEVSVSDISFEELGSLLSDIEFKSGEGIWLTPFRGIPNVGVRVPLDIIFLDENCRVIDVVESFPSLRYNTSSSRIASVLILPPHSIYLSQTQPSDQMLICKANDMECNLERFSNSGSVSTVLQSGVCIKEKPILNLSEGLLASAGKLELGSQRSEKVQVMSRKESSNNTSKSRKSWWERIWAPDPRKSERESIPGLIAYYWNGSAPEAHAVKNISTKGLYLVTDERWYPGTLITMTLQFTSPDESREEYSVSIACKSIWWGESGVGVEFVLRDETTLSAEQNATLPTTDRKELDQFLQVLRRYKAE